MLPGLAGKKVLLTGASGFVGSRLAECLTAAYGAEVHALVRRVGTAGTARLARLAGVALFYGDVGDAERVREAGRGCAYVIHCATGSAGSYRAQKTEERQGTENVLRVALSEGAERVVYFSSAAVHDPARSGPEIREESPLNGTALGWRKILSEALAAEYRRREALPIVVLRPTCVWGPFSPTWTVAAAELIARGVPFLPRAGGGTANVVYVDNLVDAVYLAMITRAAVGETFLINDDEPGTWGELYTGYARCLAVPLHFLEEAAGARELVGVSLHNARLLLRHVLAGRLRPGVVMLRQMYDHVPLVKMGVLRLPAPVQQRLRHVAAGAGMSSGGGSASASADPGFRPYGLTSRPMRELYGATARYSNGKAKRLLGWRPRTSFRAALDITCEWLRYAGYAPVTDRCESSS